MKKWIAIAAAVPAVLAIFWLSVVRVPAGSFGVAGGRVLDPGWHLKAPWSPAGVYPEREVVSVRLSLLTREGARKEGEVRVDVAWDPDRLAQNQVGRGAVGEALASLTEYPGAGLRQALKERLQPLPLRLLALSADIEGELPEAVKAAYRPTGRKVVHCGLDALDWVLVDRLIAEGRMPTFARLKREAAWGNLLSFKPMLSPLLWTSIGTSRPPDQHGILDFIIQDPATGKPMPITAHYRKVQAFWNILSAFNLKTHVVGWWATFPAEKINGVMVSERLFFSLFGMEPPKMVPGNTYPPDAEARFAHLMVKAEQVPFEELGRFVRLDRTEMERRWAAGSAKGDLHEDRVNHLRIIIASTRSVLNITEALLAEPFDVLSYYIEGTDTAAHRFAECLPPRLARVSEEEFRMGKDALPRFYEWMDEELAAMMAKAPPDALWIINSDHGFFLGEARPSSRPDDFTTGAPQWHRQMGAVVIAGPGVKPGEIKDADIYDIIPTMFHALGVPASREWKGRALADVLPSLPAVPPVDTYEFLPPPQRDLTPAVLDEERIKELQALGYLAGPAQAPAGPKGETPPPDAAPREDFSQAYNLANTLYQQGDLDGAMAQYLRSVELRPDFSLGMFSLAQCHAMKGDHRQAYAWLKRALAHPQHLPPKVLVHLVDEAREIGAVDEALEVLNAVRPAWEQEPTYSVAMGLAHGYRGDEKKALEWLERARRQDPSNALAVEELLKRHVARRDQEAISRLLKDAWDSAAGSISIMNYLGIICLRNGQGKIAEEIFRKVMESDPDNGGLLANLAIALQMQGRARDAETYFARAVRLQPDNAQLHYNYGACLAELDRPREALALFGKARTLGFKGHKLYTSMARIHYRLGQKAEARAALEQALALDPSNADARQMLETLKKE